MNATFMLADDDRTVRSAIRKALEAEGFSFASASDGKTEISIALSGGVDLAILNLMVPTLDGKEVLSPIGSSGLALPTIFLSSRDEEFDRVLGLELGADDYLLKPFSLRELVARVKALLRRSKSLIWTHGDRSWPRLPFRRGRHMRNRPSRRVLKGVSIALFFLLMDLLLLFLPIASLLALDSFEKSLLRSQEGAMIRTRKVDWYRTGPSSAGPDQPIQEA